MRTARVAIEATLWLLFTSGLAFATDMLKAVGLPPAEGTIVSAAFSPDNIHLAIIRSNASDRQNELHVLDVRTGKEVSHVSVQEESFCQDSQHAMSYSSDGRYLLLTATGADAVLVFDTTEFQVAKRIVLHPLARPLLSQRPNYFRGVISLATASKADIFGVLTHDELRGNEIFMGSFSSLAISKSWSIGQGRTFSQIGHSALSLADDGLQVAVSILPEGNKVPKNFDNLRLYDSKTGSPLNMIRTGALIGQIKVLPDQTVLTARLDAPSMFGKKACLEIWSFATGKLTQTYCDANLNVEVTFATAKTNSIVVGFAAQVHKDFEGHIEKVNGRIIVWNAPGNIVSESQEFPNLVRDIVVSPDSNWIFAAQTLFSR